MCPKGKVSIGKPFLDASTEVGCLKYQSNNKGGGIMELEVVEGSCDAQIEPTGSVEPAGCPEGGFMVGCCIIHYWCWDPGHGLCC